MSTITKGATIITPDLVLGLSLAVAVSPIKHELVGGGLAYSLRSPGPRTGKMNLLFPDAAAAFACFNLHLEVGVFVYVDTEHSDRSMTYLVDGTVEPVLDPETRQRWVVAVEYSEVTS